MAPRPQDGPAARVLSGSGPLQAWVPARLGKDLASRLPPAGEGHARPDRTPVEDLIPVRPTLQPLRQAAAGCRACDLWAGATQTVFGEGSEDADRAPDAEARQEQMAPFVRDLHVAARLLPDAAGSRRATGS